MPSRQTIRSSAAVKGARTRRASTAGKNIARIEWFVDEVTQKIEMTMHQRVKLATALVKNKVIKNISKPVGRAKTPISGKIIVTERSKPGEFPRADTTQLMKTIFSVTRKEMNGSYGYVATPLDYGLILETKMNRSFLVRTLREESGKVEKILTGPIKGGGRASGFRVR